MTWMLVSILPASLRTGVGRNSRHRIACGRKVSIAAKPPPPRHPGKPGCERQGIHAWCTARRNKESGSKITPTPHSNGPGDVAVWHAVFDPGRLSQDPDPAGDEAHDYELRERAGWPSPVGMSIRARQTRTPRVNCERTGKGRSWYRDHALISARQRDSETETETETAIGA